MIWLDDETFSSEPISNGTHRYAEGAAILIRAVALDDGPVVVRDLTPGGEDWELRGDELVPADPFYLDDIDQALADDQAEIWAHNSHFDRTLERHAGIPFPLHRWRDTMVQALAHSLPGKLSNLCEVLRIDADDAKDKDGKRLINLFCKPISFHFPKLAPFRALQEGEDKKAYSTAKRDWKARHEAAKAAAAANWPGRATRESHPEEWHRFMLYAGRDILAMRACHKAMPKWNYPNNKTEVALWHLDQEINDRGVLIDLDLARAAVAAVDVAQEELKARGQELTNGEVESVTKRDSLLEHVLAEYGVDLPDMQKATLERRIEDPDLPEGLRELLRIRLQAATTSTSKYKVLLRAASSDSRLRNLLQFLGAARTGRWAGRLWQPQNLPSRGLLPPDEIELGIEALLDGSAALLFSNIMHLTSSAIRGCVVAPPGKKLVVADLSNIEGRDQAWLAGESWKLRAFREFDTFALDEYGQKIPEKDDFKRVGPDLYKMSYGKSFNVHPSEVTKDQRQIGKVQELALGYEGGVGAFVTFAANYGIDLDELAAKAVRFIPGEVFGQAQIMLQWHRSKGRDPAGRLKMVDRTWLVCESFKIGWRAGHKEIAAYWKQLDACVRAAIEQPGRTIPCGKVKIRRDGAWLRIVLPSGRALCYPSPALQAEKRKKDDAEVAGLEVLESDQPATGRTKITYMGVHQYTRKWTRLDTYGGKIFENICQAVARDVMAHNMPAIEAAGYSIILTVHDEVICEAPDSPEYNADHLAGLLARNPPWALDMPLAAAGFEAYRYKKD